MFSNEVLSRYGRNKGIPLFTDGGKQHPKSNADQQASTKTITGAFTQPLSKGEETNPQIWFASDTDVHHLTLYSCKNLDKQSEPPPPQKKTTTKRAADISICIPIYKYMFVHMYVCIASFVVVLSLPNVNYLS